MTKSSNNFFILMALLLFIGCVGSYNIPSISKQKFVFNYEYNEPYFKKSNIPVILLSAVINEKNDAKVKLDDSDEEAIRTNTKIAYSIESFTKDLEKVIYNSGINQSLKKDINEKIKTILKNKGFTNIISLDDLIDNLDYNERTISKLVIQPIVNITQKIICPTQDFKHMGRNRGESPTYAIRTPLISNYEANIELKFYEPFTEKIVSIFGPSNKKNISERFDSFIDSYWTFSGMKLIVYQGIAFTNFEEKYGVSLASVYQDLIQTVDDNITLEYIENAYSECDAIQKTYIPTSDDIISNFSYVPTKSYKKLKNVYAVLIKSDLKNDFLDNDIHKKFNSSLNDQIIKVFGLRGIDILDTVSDTDDMVYSDKKGSYFAIKISNKINLHTGKLREESKVGKLVFSENDINIDGEFTLSIFETMTKQKLLEKSINIDDKIQNVNQVFFSGVGQKVKLFDNSDERLFNQLVKNFDKICNDLWSILSPSSINEIKQNVNEIRSKVGFPILN